MPTFTTLGLDPKILRLLEEIGFEIRGDDEAIALYSEGRVKEMIRAEREACAKLAEDKFDFCGNELLVADAIRARGDE